MPDLRTHARDAAIGAISQRNCEAISRILEAHVKKLKHPIFGWFYKDRKDRINLEMASAAFARVNGVPEPLPAQFDVQVAMAMGRHAD